MDVDVALSEVPVNKVALIDDTDFKTREESVVYNQSGMDLVWNFVTTAGAYTQTAVTPTTSGDYDWTNQGNGMYSIEIPASGGASINNDTEGFGWFTGFATGILPWTGPIIGFRSATVNDALIDSNTFITSDDLFLPYESTIATVNSQTSFDMNDSIVTDDNWIGNTVSIRDVSTGDTWFTWVTDVDQTNDRIIINEAPAWTVVTTDEVRVSGMQHPTYALNLFDPPTRTELTTDTNSILNKLLIYVQLMVRKDSAIATDKASDLNAINTDEGSGAGAYDNTTDSLEKGNINSVLGTDIAEGAADNNRNIGY
jgi:hypothetical protein